MSPTQSASILEHKSYSEDSVFLPENLLREARRQKNMQDCKVPEVCVLNPDGDLTQYLINKGAEKNACWACYHSRLYSFALDNTMIGFIPFVVGASYAVLVAEQLFVSGCELLISVTSAGVISSYPPEKRFALIKEAVRDEGTSYHYLPSGSPAVIAVCVFRVLSDRPAEAPWFNAKSWTTDAPYRETQTAITKMKEQGVTCVEMEAAALYAFAEAKGRKVVCFAHLTNTMAQEEGDFEKGEHFGSVQTLRLIEEALKKFS